MSYPPSHLLGADVPAGSISRGDFRLLYPGESQHVEFKQGMPQTIAEAVTAFSNSDGGVVLIGVTSDGTPHGVSIDGQARAKLHRIVGTVHQSGPYEIRALHIEGVSVLALSVARRKEGFAQTADGRVLERRDAMNVAVIGERLAELVRRKELSRFERTGTGRSLDDADPACMEALATAYGWSESVEQRLVENGFAAIEKGQLMLTVAGVLYLLVDPGEALGKSYIEVFRYRDDGTSEDKRYQISGPLPQQVREVTHRITDEIGHDVVVLGLHRQELDRLPLNVLREAVANAVAHRVYEDGGRAVRVEVRPRRVTITSPGPLPEPVTVDTMRDQNVARNVTIIAALRRFRLAEDAGRGVDLMQDVMAQQLLDPPEFSADESSVTVTLPLTSTVTTAERAWIGELHARGELRGPDRTLLLQAARGRTLTNSRARELLGLDSTHARAALQRLRDAGFLRQEGERSGARYLLAPTIAPPPGLRMSQTDLRHTVEELAAEQPVTNARVRERLGLDRVEALRLLAGLVADGRLVREGARRGTRYLLPKPKGPTSGDAGNEKDAR